MEVLKTIKTSSFLKIKKIRKKERHVKKSKEENPVMKLVGLFSSSEKDLAENHNRYTYSR